MALTKVLTGGIALDAVDNTILKLDDDYALTGTVTGTVAGSAAFCARHGANEWGSVNNGGIVNFNDDSTGDSFDTDNCYSTSTYKFTAPAAGVYMFWFSIYAADGDNSNGFSFLKNSSKVAITHSQDELMTFTSAFDNDHVQTATIILPLASGDTMAACGALTSSDYYKGHSKWGGCRLA
jgi:hypothetical protein